MIYREIVGSISNEYEGTPEEILALIKGMEENDGAQEGTPEEIKEMLKAECNHTGAYDHAALNTGNGVEMVCLRCEEGRSNECEITSSERLQKQIEEFQKNEKLRAGKITVGERVDIIRSIKEFVCTLNDKDAVEKMLRIKFAMAIKREYAKNQKALEIAEVHQYGIRGFIDDMPLDTEVYKDDETVWFILKSQGLAGSVYEVPLQPIYLDAEL